MPARQLLKADVHSATAVFDALADRLPPPHERCVNHSELEFSNTKDLKRVLDQGDLIVARYTNFWLKGLERHGDFFVVWTFGSLGGLLVFMLIGGMLGLLDGSGLGAAVLFGASILAGLGLAIRYAQALPPMAEQSVTLISGESRELIHVCRVLDDEPREQLVRVPLRDLVVKLSWGQIADHFPSFLSVLLCAAPSVEDKNQNWPTLCLATFNHSYPAPAPDEWVRKAKDFADVLGARYVGVEPLDA